MSGASLNRARTRLPDHPRRRHFHIPNVIAAILILVVAIAVAGAIAGGVAKLMGDTALGKIVASTVPVLVLTIATFMALVQLEIAVPIVTGAFYIVLGAFALGAALAFGLGGRNSAQRLLDAAYDKGRDNIPQMREEMRLAKQRASERVEGARTELDQDGRLRARRPTLGMQKCVDQVPRARPPDTDSHR